MSKRVTLILVVAAAVAGLVWLLVAGRDPAATEDATASDDSRIDRKAIVAKKMRARADGDIDLSPARASGRVVQAQGAEPIAHAVVLLTPKGIAQQSRGVTPGESAMPLRAITDADGRWEMDPVLSGRYSLSAAARGFLPGARSDVTLAAGKDNAGLDLTLTRGGHEVSGTVSDIGGGPVEEVLVRVTRTDESPFNFNRPALGAVTDEEGHFVLQLGDGRYSLSTFHPDYVEATKTLRVDGGPRSVELRVTPAGSISGQVLSRLTGEPVPGAVVTRGDDSGGGFTVQGVGDGQVVADDEGRFVLRGLSSGVTRLSAFARGFTTRQPVDVILGVAEEVDDVEILVDEALMISGFVVARGDEERGLEGVLVGAFSVDPPRLYAAASPSSADGYFEILGVLPGGYTVGAVGEDALPNFLGSSAQVLDKDVTDVLVVMDAGVHVRGRVTPPGSAKISLQIDQEGMSIGTMMQSMSNSVVRAQTDGDGVFDLHPVAAGKITVVAEADDGSHGEVEIEVTEADVEDLVIELSPRASVEGRVVDASGKPSSGLTVTFRSRDTKNQSFRMSFNGSGSGQGTATTDEQGNYAARGLAGGDYDVSVSGGRGPTLEWAQPADPKKPSEPIMVTVAEAEQRKGYDLAVESRDGVITGVVLGADGVPVTDAWVTAVRNDSAREWMKQLARKPEDGEPAPDDDEEPDEDEKRNIRQWENRGFAEPPVLTDEIGRFEVRDLRSGTYRLRAEAHKDGSRGFVEQVDLGQDVRIDLEPLAGLEGVVRFAGKPVREFTIEARGMGRRQKQVFDEEGKFLLPRLDAGPYEIVASCSDGTAHEEIEITAGANTQIALDIGGWGTLTGKVVDVGTGDPIAGLSVTVIGDGGTGARSVMGMFTGVGPHTDEDGRFSVDEVPPGEGQILFMDRDASIGSGGGGPVAQQEYTIEAEEEHDLGTINGVAPSYLKPDERGTVGLTIRVATYAKRPRAPEAEEDEEQAVFDETNRLWVALVTPDGPAALEGLVPGDEILSVDGGGVKGMGASNAAKMLSPRHLRVGDDVSLEVEHDGSRRTVTLTAIAREED